jgi:hypothetical protein
LTYYVKIVKQAMKSTIYDFEQNHNPLMPLFGGKAQAFGEKMGVFCPKMGIFGGKSRVFSPKVGVFGGKSRIFGGKSRIFSPKVGVFDGKSRVFCPGLGSFPSNYQSIINY